MVITRLSKMAPLTHDEMDQNWTWLDTNPDGIKMTNNKGEGIKLNPAAPVFGWHDLIGVPVYDPNANNPTMAPMIGSIKFNQFDVGNEGFINFHIPHDYAPGTDLYLHVHWTHSSDEVTGGSVEWQMDITYAKGHRQGVFLEPITMNITGPCDTTKYTHMIDENAMTSLGGSASSIDSTLIEVDGVVGIRFALNSNDIEVSSGDKPKPFLFSVDIHYQSTGIPTIGKSPDFYAA